MTVKPIKAYVLRDLDGVYHLVVSTSNPYWIGRILRKLEGMREKDLKSLWRGLQKTLEEE